MVSTIQYFRDEYEAHVKEKRCPAKICQKLKIYIIDRSCKGCSKCARLCPVGAISGKIKQPFKIDPEQVHQVRRLHCGLRIPGNAED